MSISQAGLLSLSVIAALAPVVRAAETGADAAAAQAVALGQALRRPSSPNTHPDSQWFPDAGLGLFIHWGIASVRGDGDLSWCMMANKSWADATVKPAEYYALIKSWKPDALDYDAMLAKAKAAGVNYAVMVTKHHDGFTLWPSAFGEIGTKGAFAGRDFVKEYVAACRKHGIRVGLYYSPPDWYFDREYRSWAFGGGPLDMNHRAVKLPAKPKDHDTARRELVRGQVAELLSNYGKIDLIWFDGGSGEIPNAEVRRLQPGIVVNRRNGGGGDYGDSEGCLPSTRFKGWFEACVTVWPMRMWSHSPKYPQTDARTVLTMYSLMRAWGGNLLANVGPRGDGALLPATVKCWSEMGAWMSHSRESVEAVNPGPWPEKVNQPVTIRGRIAYIHFLPKLPETFPGLPPEERKFTKPRQVMPSLPAYAESVVWSGAPEPRAVTLLRTGAPVPHSWKEGTLTVTPSAASRADSVEVVKVEWR